MSALESSRHRGYATCTAGMAVKMSRMGARYSATVSCSLVASTLPAWLSEPYMNACIQHTLPS